MTKNIFSSIIKQKNRDRPSFLRIMDGKGGEAAMKYGRKKCEHEWRYRKDGWVEGCVPAICIKCGAFGCGCQGEAMKVPKDIFFNEGANSNDNIGGSWDNPYVRRGE